MTLIIAAILLAGGIWLLQRGYLPRRAGQTPHCPACNYILTGIQADRCPECGRALWLGNIVHGERRRKPGLAVAGIALIVLALALLTAPFIGALQQIDWYHYRPTSWVIGDLDAGSSAERDKAWTELQRRLADGSVSAAQQNRLVERALREQQAGGGPTGYMSAMIDFLGKRYLDHKMSPAQSDAFFANAMKLQLDVRPVVGQNDPVPFRISAIGHGPLEGWWMRMSEQGCWVDDRSINQGTMSSTGGFSGSTTTTNLTPQPPGKHRLRIQMQVGAGTGNFPRFDDPLDHPRTIDLTADFQVIVGKVSIQWTSSPDVATVGRRLMASNFRIDSDASMALTGQIGVVSPPANLAFDVFARVDGKEYPLGGVSFHQNSAASAIYQVSSQSLPPGDLRQIDIILRSSARVAKQTIDFTTAWEGEVVIPNVPVRQPPASRPGTPTTEE